MTEDPARNRYFAMVFAQMIAVAGAVFGLIIMGRAEDMVMRLLGAAILLSGLYCIAVVPRALTLRSSTRSTVRSSWPRFNIRPSMPITEYCPCRSRRRGRFSIR